MAFIKKPELFVSKIRMAVINVSHKASGGLVHFGTVAASESV